MPFLKEISRSKWEVGSEKKQNPTSHIKNPASHISPLTSWLDGFTLIELLIVISIIGILVASATASWQNAQIKGRDGKRKADAKATQQALELYLQKNGQYPASSSGQIQCAILGDSHVVDWGTEFACTPSGGSKIVYMQSLPKDPAYQDTAGYYYTASTNFSYILSAKLENESDPELTGLPCTPQTGRNWCVKNP